MNSPHPPSSLNILQLNAHSIMNKPTKLLHYLKSQHTHSPHSANSSSSPPHYSHLLPILIRLTSTLTQLYTDYLCQSTTVPFTNITNQTSILINDNLTKMQSINMKLKSNIYTICNIYIPLTSNQIPPYYLLYSVQIINSFVKTSLPTTLPGFNHKIQMCAATLTILNNAFTPTYQIYFLLRFHLLLSSPSPYAIFLSL